MTIAHEAHGSPTDRRSHRSKRRAHYRRTRGALVVLFGSYARGSQSRCSDIDVCIVGDPPPDLTHLIRDRTASTAHLSTIVYSADEFAQLCARGALFVHHILTEGVLLAGDPEQWAQLRRTFRVQESFVEEFRDEMATASLLGDVGVFGGKYLHALSHAFLTLKNACIYSLASRGVYVYGKDESIQTAAPLALRTEDLLLLRRAHRSTLSPSAAAEWIDSPHAPDALGRLLPIVEELANARR